MSGDVAHAFARFSENAAMKGLMLDLRYDGGGSDHVSFDIASHLIDQPLEAPVYEVTSYRADFRAEGKRQEVIREQAASIAPVGGKRFTGPLVVLIGEQTRSATEDGFLSVIRNRPRTTFVGEPDRRLYRAADVVQPSRRGGWCGLQPPHARSGRSPLRRYRLSA